MIANNYRKNLLDSDFNGRSLRTRITFVAENCEIRSVEERLAVNSDTHYWIIRDKYGAQMSCWLSDIASTIKIGGVYKIEGKVNISKGGIYLNIQKVFPQGGDVSSLAEQADSTHDDTQPPRSMPSDDLQQQELNPFRYGLV